MELSGDYGGTMVGAGAMAAGGAMTGLEGEVSLIKDSFYVDYSISVLTCSMIIRKIVSPTDI